MATLVLTAVGTLVGGPIGGAIGAVVGNAIDRAVLFRPSGREGPRLNDLAIQTSVYGAPIAHVFGTMRVAGSVIWATDLIERRATDGGGKGGPEVTTYSYFASFAVALSARPIGRVGRVWADGKLLRGAGGDFKSACTFRLHQGGEDQAVDPLIASAEDAGLAPAHRGVAYAVFEELALEDFGNRIPSLTFEVVADEAPVTIGAIVSALSDGAVRDAGAGAALIGYSAYGDRLRGTVDALADAGGAWLAEDGGGLALRTGEGEASVIDDAGARGRGVREIAGADATPKRVSLAYHDPARDYQTGLQRAERPGAGTRAIAMEVPAAVAAETAAAMAADALARAEAARERRRVTLDWRGMAVRPGGRVRIAGERGVWRVAGWSLEAMVLTLDLVRIARATAASDGDAGRASRAVDLAHGPTTVFAFEAPALGDATASAPMLTIAAAGASPGWRSAVLSLSTDGGASWTTIGRSRAPAVIGHVATPPGVAPATLIDRRTSADVLLLHDDMLLADGDAARLDAGANLAMLGDELIQFGRAERIGARRWRLSDLWRGRRGTEWAAGLQTAGDRFVLLDPASLTNLALPPGTSAASVMASSIGDPEGVVVTSALDGASVRPPSPAQLVVRRTPDGGIAAHWVRRSRSGWRWIDGVDAPLGEEREAYQITIGERIVETTAPALTLPTEEVPDGATTIAVAQVGAHGVSRTATAPIPDA